LKNARSGSALLAVLIVVFLLSLAAYQYSELTVQEYRTAVSSLRALQIKAVADSGVAYTAALLADPNSFTGTLNSNPYSNDSSFAGIQVFTDPNDPNRIGRFWIVAAVDQDNNTTGQTIRYGVSDEAGKLNPNAMMQIDSTGQVLHDMLMKFTNGPVAVMTEDIADSIVDWIDPDDDPRPNGAESSSYTGMTPPYRCKNAPLDSVEELLLVRGMTPQILFGTDWNRNGVQDNGEDTGSGWDPGLAAYLTVYSRERNVDNDGNARIFLNDTNLKSQYDKINQAFGQTFADFLALYRGDSSGGGGGGAPGGQRTIRTATAQEIRQKVNSILNATSQQQRPKTLASRFELMNASVTWTIGTGRNQQEVRVTSPLADTSQQRTLLPLLLDKTTTQQATELPPRVNVLTAPRAVLSTLPGLNDTDVQNLMDHRPDPLSGQAPDDIFKTPAWMITEANVTTAKMQALERYVTSRTQIYRIQIVAQFDNGGPSARVEAVIDINNGKPRILMYRDLTELGRGFDVTNPNK
jgi:type II secretory pathway component PulK